jgi:Protein of unknown function (DUF968).
MMRFPKPEPLRDKFYLAWMRRQGCLIDGRTAHVHHVQHGGVGTKGSDHETVPFCWRHHREMHDIGRLTFEEKHGLNLDRECERYRELYLRFRPEERE